MIYHTENSRIGSHRNSPDIVDIQMNNHPQEVAFANNCFSRVETMLVWHRMKWALWMKNAGILFELAYRSGRYSQARNRVAFHQYWFLWNTVPLAMVFNGRKGPMQRKPDERIVLVSAIKAHERANAAWSVLWAFSIYECGKAFLVRRYFFK